MRAGGTAPSVARMFRNEILSHPRLAQLAVPATLLAAGLGLTADRAAASAPSTVQAEVKHGTLVVRGSAGADAVALRARASSSKLEVDAGDDDVAVTGAAGTVNVTGLAAAIELDTVEGAHDLLTINGRGGHDRLDDSGLAPNTIGLAFNQ
jgi:hypothetical protein